MVIIFANLNTTEKVAVNLPNQSMVKACQSMLNLVKKGNWVRVDELKEMEIIEFVDNNLYRGFEVDKERYFDTELITNITK
jgi:hypothetical protein